MDCCIGTTMLARRGISSSVSVVHTFLVCIDCCSQRPFQLSLFALGILINASQVIYSSFTFPCIPIQPCRNWQYIHIHVLLSCWNALAIWSIIETRKMTFGLVIFSAIPSSNFIVFSKPIIRSSRIFSRCYVDDSRFGLRICPKCM